MAKKSKDTPATETSSVSSAAPVKRAALTKMKAPKSSRSSSNDGSKKSAATKAAKKPSGKKATKKSQIIEPSDADIRLRAYFIAERRVQLALQGDPSRDWIEAKQQLLAEARQASS